MLQKKKKITKREIKHDTLVDSFFASRAWYYDNKKQVTTIGTIVLIFVVAVWFYFNNQNTKNLSAATDFGKIFSFYDNGQYDVAKNGIPEQNILGLESIVENYGSSNSGNLAKIYLANIELSKNNIDRALELFEDFSSNDAVLNASAKAGIASCYEAKKDFSSAANFFEKAAKYSTIDETNAEYLICAARNYSLIDKKEKAIELYKLVKSEYSSTTSARDAERFISEIIPN